MAAEQLVGSEIHGFHTLEEFWNILKDAERRWLLAPEIHAILCNHKYLTININPVKLSKSGNIVLFDRGKCKHFRNDGHNWRKKTNGSLNESHEYLKVRSEERIHVYYAHGQDNSSFVRRCYWLLDKNLAHIVLVHYRVDHVISGMNHFLESIGPGDSLTVQNHELILHMLNTWEWDELLLPKDEVSRSNQPTQIEANDSLCYVFRGFTVPSC